MIKKLFIPIILVAFAGLGIYYFGVLKPSKSPSSAVSASSMAQKKKALSIPKPPNAQATKQIIDEIRGELQNVMKLNEKINQTQSSKASQLLRIQEQASAHQRILSNIEQMNNMSNPAVPSREALLAQEKLRIIREETLRNKEILEKTSSNQTS